MQTTVRPTERRILTAEEAVEAEKQRKEAREKFVREYGGEVFNTVEELCACPNVDAVYVCTPNPFHAEHVITAAEHGKHVIVEKPMGLSIEECEAMNAAVERNGVKLLCGHTHSFDAPIRKMHEIVRSRKLGALCMINTWNYNEFMYRLEVDAPSVINFNFNDFNFTVREINEQNILQRVQ